MINRKNKMSLDKLIENTNTEFYELGVSHGFDQGYNDGIGAAIQMLEVLGVKIPEEEFPSVFGSPEDVHEEIEDEHKITRSPHVRHLDFWKSNTEPFKGMLEAGTMNVDEAVVAGKNFGIDKSRIVAKAHKLGFGIKDGEFYRKRVIHE